MPLYTYNRDIPAAANNPSSDQPLMQTNTNHIDDIIDEDHYSFDESNGGLHRQVRMPVGTIPTVASGSGALYTKSSTGSQLFYTPDNGGNEYQMTRCISASFTTFSTNTSYGAPPATFTQTGGWTYLPGGMLLQYGFYGKTGALGSSGTIQFPVTFSTGCYSVTTSLSRSSSGDQSLTVNSITTSSFLFKSSSSGSDGVYWQAIGV